MTDLGTSTLASGPAGTHFEAQVGASYLLAMLSGAPPRGLPGTTIDRVALQQGNAGRPLDDVIIYAHDNVSGKSAVLEIQVKRSITFAATDPVFRKVVGQIVKASQRPDFLTQRYELAIATTKGSRKIDGAYQDVLTLARQIGDAASFGTQIDLAGVANDDMRTFVKTFKNHLRDEGSPDDNENVWLLLRRLQILTFDFTAPGSASHDLALERAVRVLHADDRSRVGAFWGNLVELVIDVAKSGGDKTRETALQALAQLGYRFVGERRHATALAALAESSRLALADIRNHVGTRLGEPATHAHLGNPEFMVRYAQNLSDAINWQEVEVALKDGSSATVRKYLSPMTEQTHLQALKDAATERESNFTTRSALSLAVDDPSQLLPEVRSAAVAWARRTATASEEVTSDDGERYMQEEAIVTAAMIVMRDGDNALRAEHGEWARSILNKTLANLDDDPARQIRGGLRFNPTAIAYAGLIHALRYQLIPEDKRLLLEVAATGNHAAAHGFGMCVAVLADIDSRLPKAVLRCAFAASVEENRVWGASQDEDNARKARSHERARAAVVVEMAWLCGEGREPAWPTFPVEQVQTKRRLRIPRTRIAAEEPIEDSVLLSTEHVNHRAAALWLRQVRILSHDDTRPWLFELIKAYMPWTSLANGASLDDGKETDNTPSEWNGTFFDAAARCVVGLTTLEAIELTVRHIVKFPVRNFYDVLVDFLRSIDSMYFNGHNIPTQVAVDIRSALVDHMLTTDGWERLCRSRDLSIEMHISSAISILFFNDHMYGQGSKCYLFERGVERIGPFLPALGKLAINGPSPFVALVLLNLLEVAPRAEQLDLLVGAGSAWIEAYPDFRQLWIDHGVGRRWCLLMEAIRARSPVSFSNSAPMRPVIDTLVASLIAFGVPEATRLEEELSKL